MSTPQGEAGPQIPAKKRLSNIDWACGMDFDLFIDGPRRGARPLKHRDVSGATQTSSSLLSTQRTPTGRRRNFANGAPNYWSSAPRVAGHSRPEPVRQGADAGEGRHYPCLCFRGALSPPPQQKGKTGGGFGHSGGAACCCISRPPSSRMHVSSKNVARWGYERELGYDTRTHGDGQFSESAQLLILCPSEAREFAVDSLLRN